MGENKHIEELDAFTKKYVKEIKQEQPSTDFTASIMQTILVEQKSPVFKTKPLISKKGWLGVFLFMVMLLFIPFKETDRSLFNFSKIDFSFFDKIQIFNLFESFTISNTVLYAIFFFGLLVIAQVVFLKNYFNKRFE